MKSVTKNLKRLALGSLIIFCSLVFFGAWALSSPPGSGPDDEYHLAAIWCSQGFRMQFCAPSEIAYEVKVPKTILRYGGPLGLFCYTGNSKISGRCIRSLDATSVTKLESTTRVNTGRYPERFYRTNGYLVSGNTNSSILWMRFLQVAVCIGVVGFALSSSGERKWAILLALFVGLVPVGLFTIPSTNPSSWAVTGVVAASISAMNFFVASRKKQRWLAVFGFILATFVAMGARPDSALMLGIGVLLGVVAGVFGRPYKSFSQIRRPQLLFLSFLTGSVLLYIHLRVFSLDPRNVYQAFTADGSFRSFSSDAPQVLIGLIGGSAQLGSPDFATPSAVLVLMAIGLASLVTTMIRFVSQIVKLSSVFGASLLFLLPFSFSIGGGATSRYVLAIYLTLLATLVASAVIGTTPTRFTFTNSAKVTIFIAVSIAQSLALHQSIRRYVTGTNTLGWNLNNGAEWWWTYGPSPLSIWILGTVSFAIAIFSALTMTNRPSL